MVLVLISVSVRDSDALRGDHTVACTSTSDNRHGTVTFAGIAQGTATRSFGIRNPAMSVACRTGRGRITVQLLSLLVIEPTATWAARIGILAGHFWGWLFSSTLWDLVSDLLKEISQSC